MRIYPASFRDRYERELIEFLAEERQHPRYNRWFLGTLKFWICTLTDLVRTAVRLRKSRPVSALPAYPVERKRVFIMDTIWQDVKYAWRGMVNRPGFTLVLVTTLALGIGANSSIFCIVNSVVLRPLPYSNPDALVYLWEQNYQRDVLTNVVSPANYFAWKEQSDAFTDMGAIAQASSTITGNEQEPERVGTVQLSPSIFSMLGVRAHRGRLLVQADDAPDSPPVVVLGYGIWQRRFGLDPDVVGSNVTLNGSSYEVVGVLPRGFEIDLPVTFNSTGSQDIWAPMQFDEGSRSARGRWLQVIASLREGTSVELAQNQMSALGARLEQEYPEAQTGWTVSVVPMHTQLVGDVRTPLFLLMGSVAFVLLIACANVANLLLAGATGRQKEIAVRAALGAGRGRMVRQLLTESLILSLLGGVAGLFVAYAVVQALLALSPADLPRIGEIGINFTVVAFTVVLSLLTGAVFGTIPAIRTSGMDARESLSQAGDRGGTSLRHNRTRNALVVTEFALSLVLLVGAGLLVRSFAELINVDVGFETSGALSAQIYLPAREYQAGEDRIRFFENAVEQARALPGVNAASAITFMPLTGPGSATSFWVNDRAIPGDGEKPVADVRWIHRDYHEALGVPLVSGRYFGLQDDANAPLSVIINEWAAREYWPSGDAVGKTISMPWGDTLVAEIVGVVGNVGHEGPRTTARPKLYWDHRQFSVFNQMTLFARTDTDPMSLAAGFRRVVADADPDLPLYNVRTMDDYYSESVAQARFSMVALAVSAVVALVLACVGIYGVISYAVTQRTKEIGIRIALGAGSGTVISQILKGGAKLLGVAVVLGVLGSVAIARLMEGLVFEVPTIDPVTIVVVSLLLSLIALSACYLPARRASKIDPIAALREE